MTGFDSPDARQFARDMRALPEQLNRHVASIVERGALNIKNKLRDDLRAHRHFRAVASAISYDIDERSFAGSGIIEAEIGPDKDAGGGRRPGVRGNEADVVYGPGALANIAYFGTPTKGGGGVPDPAIALEEEAPRFERELDALIGQVFGKRFGL